MSKYTPEQVEQMAVRCHGSNAHDCANMLKVYATTLRQQAERVDESAQDIVAKAIADVIGHGMREKCYAHADAVLAALAQNKQAERTGGEGEAVAESCANHVKGETGYCTFFANVPFGAKLYLHPPAQQSGVAVSGEVVRAAWSAYEHSLSARERFTQAYKLVAMRAALEAVAPLLAGGVADGWVLVPQAYVDAVKKAAGIASAYSPCIDAVEAGGGDDHEDPSCAIHHILYYASFLLAARPSQPTDAQDGENVS